MKKTASRKRPAVMKKLGKQLGIKMPKTAVKMAKVGAKKMKPVKKGAGFVMKAKAEKAGKKKY